MEKKKIFCLVTNDLNQDQRMAKICHSLKNAGYEPVLLGRSKKDSKTLIDRDFQQKRLNCFFNKGFLFYAEFNLRLFFYLWFQSYKYTYAVDLDTVLPACLMHIFRKKKFVFDAHELFTETPELENRRTVQKIWDGIGDFCVPRASLALTVNASLAGILSNKYGIPFTYIYNAPVLTSETNNSEYAQRKKGFQIIYQGVLNKGRCLETMIEAMKYLPEAHLVIVGEGDLSDVLRSMAADSEASDRITFTGWLFGEDLNNVTRSSWLGVNILESNSKNYYFSLANKFFDYMHAGIPAVHMSFPEYTSVLERYPVGLAIDRPDVSTFVGAVKNLMNHTSSYDHMVEACKEAKHIFNWQMEEKKLLAAFAESGLA